METRLPVSSRITWFCVSATNMLPCESTATP